MTIFCYQRLHKQVRSATACDGTRFSIQDLLPGKLAVAPPPSPTQKPKRMHNTYRLTQDQTLLEFRLVEWLRLEHFADPYFAWSLRPISSFFGHTESDASTCHPRKIKTPRDRTALLEESAE
ncbi:hypothetical protein V8E53_008378 [Lactarius tabidus]